VVEEASLNHVLTSLAGSVLVYFSIILPHLLLDIAVPSSEEGGATSSAASSTSRRSFHHGLSSWIYTEGSLTPLRQHTSEAAVGDLWMASKTQDLQLD